MDADKKALLLAGNRRGATVSLKEPIADGAWKIRHVNAYCPRLFSAIELPDPVLLSRTIVIPLVRSADKTKMDREPSDYDTWPKGCVRGELVDDLWSMGLENLAAVREYDQAAASYN